MTDQVVEPATTDESKVGETGKGLRAELNKRIASEKKYKTMLLEDAYRKLGLDPMTGLGKAIAKEFDGDPTVKALGEYAEAEYGYKPTPVEVTHPQAGQIVDEQGRIDQVGQVATTQQPLKENERLAKAEAEGDFATAGAIKAMQMQGIIDRANR